MSLFFFFFFPGAGTDRRFHLVTDFPEVQPGIGQPPSECHQGGVSEAAPAWRMDVDFQGTINLLLPRQHLGRLVHVSADIRSRHRQAVTGSSSGSFRMLVLT